eukprot:Skav225524  [mRNA]  locus=scaffold144:29184:31135:+ [translate_table: standard]
MAAQSEALALAALPSSEDFTKIVAQRRLSQRSNRRSKGEGKKSLLAALGIDAPLSKSPDPTLIASYSRQSSSSSSGEALSLPLTTACLERV